MNNTELLENLSGFGDIKLQTKAILGTVRMPIGSFLKLTRGSIVALDKNKYADLDITINDKKVAEGQIKVSEGDKVSIEITRVTLPKKF
jgi:flagellar motor switch protein FliN